MEWSGTYCCARQPHTSLVRLLMKEKGNSEDEAE